MPCRDYGAEEDDNRAVRDRLDVVTRHLCKVMRQLEEAGVLKDYGSKAIQSWWIEHKEADARRERDEQLARIQEKERLRNEITVSMRRLAELDRKK